MSSPPTRSCFIPHFDFWCSDIRVGISRTKVSRKFLTSSWRHRLLRHKVFWNLSWGNEIQAFRILQPFNLCQAQYIAQSIITYNNYTYYILYIKYYIAQSITTYQVKYFLFKPTNIQSFTSSYHIIYKPPAITQILYKLRMKIIRWTKSKPFNFTTATFSLSLGRKNNKIKRCFWIPRNLENKIWIIIIMSRTEFLKLKWEALHNRHTGCPKK